MTQTQSENKAMNQTGLDGLEVGREGRCSVLSLQQRGEAGDSSDPELGDTPLKFQQDAAPASKNIVNAATRACDAVHTGHNLDSLLLVLHLHSSKLTESPSE